MPRPLPAYFKKNQNNENILRHASVVLKNFCFEVIKASASNPSIMDQQGPVPAKKAKMDGDQVSFVLLFLK
jgi:hypothetical protein